jgi:long-chain fatty acid transport protein
VGPALSGITARANDATSVFWNPAGLTRLDRPELVLQTTFAYKVSKFDVDSSTFDGGNGDWDREILPIPSFYYAHPLGEDWRVGVSINVPAGIGNDFGDSWAGRYLAEETELDFVALSGVAAYRLSDRWSIGGGPLAIFTDSKTKARVNNLEPGRNDGSVKLEESGFGVGGMASLMYEFSDRTRIAATYRSEIDPDLSGEPKFNGLDPLLEAIVDAGSLDQRNIDVDFQVPEQLQIGIYHEINDKLSFTVDGIWLNMSRFGINSVSFGNDSLFVESDFRDMYIGTIGLKYRVRPDFAVSLGALYATSPISDNDRTIALPLDRTYAVGGGLEWQLSDDLVLHGSLNYADLGDGKVQSEGDLLRGEIAGNFRDNYAVVLDLALTKRF